MKQFFVDNTGSLSMGRLITFFLFVCGTIILFWSMFNNQIINNADIIKWIYGISFGGKVIQSFAENINKDGQSKDIQK